MENEKIVVGILTQDQFNNAELLSNTSRHLHTLSLLLNALASDYIHAKTKFG